MGLGYDPGILLFVAAVEIGKLATAFDYARWTAQSTGFEAGAPQQHWDLFYGLDQGVVYSHKSETPMNNILDDFSMFHRAIRDCSRYG